MKLHQKNKNLLEEINEKRSKLFDTVQKNGLSNEETVKRSQELDKLIYQYQRMVQKNPKLL